MPRRSTGNIFTYKDKRQKDITKEDIIHKALFLFKRYNLVIASLGVLEINKCSIVDL